MMWDSSNFFKRMGKNQYLFRNRGIVGKYGYLLTYKEKNAVETLLNFVGIQIMAGVLPILAYAQIRKSIVAYMGCFIYGICGSIYMYFRFKKIVGKRERVYCGRLSIFALCKAQSKLMTTYEVVKYCFMAIFMNIMMPIATNICMEEKKTSLLIMSLFLYLACIVGFFVGGLCLWYKLKENFQKDRI